MKSIVFPILASLFAFFLMSTYAAGQTKTFAGEITDEQLNCSQTPVKMPEGMYDQKLACVLYWVHYAQPAGKFVLYDNATKAVYQLDDQNLVQPFAGEKVLITGVESGKSIKVAGIKVDEKDYRNPTKDRSGS